MGVSADLPDAVRWHHVHTEVLAFSPCVTADSFDSWTSKSGGRDVNR